MVRKREVEPEPMGAEPETEPSSDSSRDADDSSSDEITRCVCGREELAPSSKLKGANPGLFVQCERCHVWQHGFCVGFVAENDVPDVYYCERCEPGFHELRAGGTLSRYHGFQPQPPQPKPRKRRRRAVDDPEVKEDPESIGAAYQDGESQPHTQDSQEPEKDPRREEKQEPGSSLKSHPKSERDPELEPGPVSNPEPGPEPESVENQDSDQGQHPQQNPEQDLELVSGRESDRDHEQTPEPKPRGEPQTDSESDPEPEPETALELEPQSDRPKDQESDQDAEQDRQHDKRSNRLPKANHERQKLDRRRPPQSRSQAHLPDRASSPELSTNPFGKINLDDSAAEDAERDDSGESPRELKRRKSREDRAERKRRTREEDILQRVLEESAREAREQGLQVEDPRPVIASRTRRAKLTGTPGDGSADAYNDGLALDTKDQSIEDLVSETPNNKSRPRTGNEGQKSTRKDSRNYRPENGGQEPREPELKLPEHITEDVGRKRRSPKVSGPTPGRKRGGGRALNGSATSAIHSPIELRKCKPRIPSARMTIPEMRRRIAAIIEFSGRTQNDMAEETKARDLALTSRRDRLGAEAASDEFTQQLEGLAQLGGESLQLLEDLTRKLFNWQDEFGS